ncbi:MAG: FkbM family methyltransferase [Verrucomicrobia bacterium]|nr:FkbM family methyltransferase [Verrucomicrobiota bacterium]
MNESRIWRRPVEFCGMKFVPPTLDRWVALQAHRLKLMGAAEFEFFRTCAQPGSHIVDVGANQGLYTLALSRQVSQGRVYAFEPDPTLFATLKENVQRNCAQNVILFNAAAASRSAELFFRPGRFNRGDNRIVGDKLASSGAIQVNAVRLDDVIPHEGIDLLKIDVQGYEMEVIQGAHQLMRANQNLLIFFEFWPHGLTLAGSGPEALLDRLNQEGFYLFRLSNNSNCSPFVYSAKNWPRPDQFCNLIATRTGNFA